MRRFVVTLCLPTIVLITLCGCADMQRGQLARLQEQQANSLAQNQQLHGRISGLDSENQEFHALVAQSRQQQQVQQEQLSALRDQLRGVNLQLAQVRKQKQESDNKVKTLTAQMRRSGGVSISANSSIPLALPAIDIPGVQVRRDRDLVRIELPGPQLFESGSAKLRPGATNLIAVAAAELARAYPRQMIGVEGHTDSDPMAGGRATGNQELSLGRAMAVYQVLTTRSGLKPGQLKVVGHGSNRPVVSNATFAGKQRNRRVELVVYPERRG